MVEKENILVNEAVKNVDTILENHNAQTETIPADILVEAIVQAPSQVGEVDIIDIQIEEAFPGTNNEDFYNHAILRNRDMPNSHPISAISGLEEELRDIHSVKRVYSSENGLAEFIRWSDNNPSWEDRSGYFVKLVYDVNTGVEHAQICTDKDDVYGVTVRQSGFVGNQINADHSDDPAYAMVGIVGLLRVRTDGTANVGDYVVPSAAGLATKSEHSCGYRVISTGSYPSYPYVTIAVTPQNDKINKIYGMLMESDGTIGNISIRIDDMESKIESANNNINVAIDSTEELKDLLEGSTVEIDRINQVINDTNNVVKDALVTVEQTIQSANDAKNAAQAAAQDARKVVTDLANMSDLADSMEDIVGYAYEDENGNVYSGAAGLIKLANETHVDYGILAEQVTEQGDDLAGMIVAVDKKHGASIQHLVSHIDKYSVGEMSLSYGLTTDEAKSILKNDYIYVPTSNHSETIGDKTVTFERGFAYTWDAENVTWVKGAAVSTATTYSAGANVGDLWYCFQDVETDEVDYLAETLYRWSGSEWIAVATMRDNYRGRMLTSIRQDADSIEQSVVALDGRLTLTEQDVDSISTTVADNVGNISAVTQRVDGIDTTIANINGTLSTTQQRVSDNEASITMINHGAFHVVQQSFVGTAPAAVGNKYTAPPIWNETTKQFEFNEELASGSGTYYFHSEDKTKYIKVVSGGYEIYTIGNLATASYDSRITENSADIAELVQYKTDNNTNIAGIKAQADADRAVVTALAKTVSDNKTTEDNRHTEAMAAIQQETTDREAAITTLTEYVDTKNGEQNKNIASIQQKADANGASIGLIVQNNAVQGGVLVEAINGTSNAYIDADNIVFGKGVGSNSGDNFYLQLTTTGATMRNGSLNINKGNFSILLDPTNGIQMKNGNSDIFFFKPDGSAKIGSWNVAGDRLYSGSGANYMALSAADTSYYVWAGSETAANAPFSVTKAGKLNATGAKISGDITMTCGSISWANINETGKSAAYELAEGASTTASNAWNRADSAYTYAGTANTNAEAAKTDLTNLVSGSYKGGTFINERNIISANFYATNDISSGAYSTMKEDGFYIYRSTTDKPKMALTANSAGTAIGLRLGAGANDEDQPDEGKLTLEKYETYAKIYYMVNHTEYGFQFDSTGVTMLGGGEFNVGTQAYAVFG